jgi:hypothetical protein
MCGRLEPVGGVGVPSRPVSRVLRRVGLLCLLTLTACAAPALASPAAVVNDYRADGVIDNPYSTSDLWGAIKLAGDDRGLADAADDKLTEVLSGIKAQRTAAAQPAPAATSGEQRAQEVGGSPPPPPSGAQGQDELNLNPGPTVGPDSSVPLAFIVMSALAGALLLTGVASTAYRRLRRSRAHGGEALR